MLNFKAFLVETQVIDLTNPNTPFKDKWDSAKQTYIKGAGEAHHYFVVLGRDKTLFYRWGDGNVVPWDKVLELAHEVAKDSPFHNGRAYGAVRKPVPHQKFLFPDMDQREPESQAGFEDITKILVTVEGNVVLNQSMDHTRWPGNRNMYSKDVPEIVGELLKRKVIYGWSKVHIGNWAGKRGTEIGTADEIMKRGNLPDVLTLYHGTNDDRWEEIQKVGLTPLPVDQRMWKGREDRGHPEYRDQAIYLTASPTQAVTYAKRAVNMARRHGYSGRLPVILQVQVSKKDWGNFRPDDDYLKKMGAKASEADWYSSLSYFGQVAYLGAIPPGQVKLFRQLNPKDIWDIERSVA